MEAERWTGSCTIAREPCRLWIVVGSSYYDVDFESGDEWLVVIVVMIVLIVMGWGRRLL